MAESLEQQRHNLTHAIGECILAWAKVEQTIACIFGCTLLSELFHVTRIFDSVISFDARRNMVEASLDVLAEQEDSKLTRDHLSKWKKLSDKSRKAYVKRNEIAHCDLKELTSQNKVVAVELLGFSTLTRDFLQAPTLDLKQLRERRNSFIDLANELWDFLEELERLVKLPPESPSQSPNNNPA
jgi:hypothetical protein